MDEATEICWYCKGEPRFSATSFCGVCYGTGFAPRSTRIRAEFATGPMIVEAPCRSCAALRAEIKTLRDRINSEIDDLMRHYHSDEHTLVNVGVQAQRLMSILRGGN